MIKQNQVYVPPYKRKENQKSFIEKAHIVEPVIKKAAIDTYREQTLCHAYTFPDKITRYSNKTVLFSIIWLGLDKFSLVYTSKSVNKAACAL